MIISYWHHEKNIEFDEHATIAPRIGEGVVLPHGNWRVVDVWHSYDKHGRLDWGTHVFVEPAGETDRPKAIWPDYYREEAATDFTT